MCFSWSSCHNALSYFPSEGGRVKMSGPSSVMATVCSKCADRTVRRRNGPDIVRQVCDLRVPMLTIGSMQMVIPAAGGPRARRCRSSGTCGSFVRRLPDAMADQVAHDPITAALRMALDRGADVPDRIAGSRLGNPFVTAPPASRSAGSWPPTKPRPRERSWPHRRTSHPSRHP